MIDRPDSAPEVGEDGEDEAAAVAKKEKPQPSYAAISTEELCVRVNSLVHCTHNIKQLASRIAYELGDTEAYVDPLAPDFDPTDRSAVDKVPLCGSIMVLESCTEQLVAFIGAKLIFHEMENELLLGLYVPTPERGIRIDGTLNAMDEVMDVLYDMLPDEVSSRLLTHAPLPAGRRYSDHAQSTHTLKLVCATGFFQNGPQWNLHLLRRGDAQDPQ